MNWFSKNLWILLIYNLLVIVWGAWVRISFSGDGCGESWPTCDGVWVPTQAHQAQWIEWSHRASTGLIGIWVFVTCLWGWFSKLVSKQVKKLLLGIFVFTILEALVGALLVKAGLVANNESVVRAWVMGFHQLNSLCLTGFIFLSAYASSQSIYIEPIYPWRRIFVYLVFSAVCFTGALAALAGTLFPSADLISGILADFDQRSHILVRLRLSHPMLATIFCVGLIIYMRWLWPVQTFQKSKLIYLVTMVSFLFGAATLVSLSPIWMKLVHLILAHLFFITILYAFCRPRWIQP